MLVHGLEPHNRARDLPSPKILTPRSFVCIPQRVVATATPLTVPRDQGVRACDELLVQVHYSLLGCISWYLFHSFSVYSLLSSSEYFYLLREIFFMSEIHFCKRDHFVVEGFC
ncbi:unnamed protein product [Camellia sinensis]